PEPDQVEVGHTGEEHEAEQPHEVHARVPDPRRVERMARAVVAQDGTEELERGDGEQHLHDADGPSWLAHRLSPATGVAITDVNPLAYAGPRRWRVSSRSVTDPAVRGVPCEVGRRPKRSPRRPRPPGPLLRRGRPAPPRASTRLELTHHRR